LIINIIKHHRPLSTSKMFPLTKSHTCGQCIQMKWQNQNVAIYKKCVRFWAVYGQEKNIRPNSLYFRMDYYSVAALLVAAQSSDQRGSKQWPEGLKAVTRGAQSSDQRGSKQWPEGLKAVTRGAQSSDQRGSKQW